MNERGKSGIVNKEIESDRDHLVICLYHPLLSNGPWMDLKWDYCKFCVLYTYNNGLVEIYYRCEYPGHIMLRQCYPSLVAELGSCYQLLCFACNNIIKCRSNSIRFNGKIPLP